MLAWRLNEEGADIIPQILSSLILSLLLCAAATTAESSSSTIHGTWIHDGQPRSNGTVKLSGRAKWLNTTTDAEGRFTFRDLEPARYELEVDLLGEEGLERERGTRGVRGGFVRQWVILGFRDAHPLLKTFSTSIAGHLRDAEGKPVQMALLWLEPAGPPPDTWTGTWFRPSDLSDRDGYFEFRGVPPGRHRLLARTHHLAPAWAWIDLPSQSAVVRQDLRLVDPSPFRFKVRHPDGRVPENVHFTLTDADDRTLLNSSKKPDRGGYVTINPPAGRWRLWVRGGHTATVVHEIEAPGRGGPWVVSPTEKIRIEGYEESRVLTVRLFDPQGRPSYRSEGGRIDAQIPYRSWVRAPAGTWTIKITGPDDYSWTGTTDVIAGEENVVRIPPANPPGGP